MKMWAIKGPDGALYCVSKTKEEAWIRYGAGCALQQLKSKQMGNRCVRVEVKELKP